MENTGIMDSGEVFFMLSMLIKCGVNSGINALIILLTSPKL